MIENLKIDCIENRMVIFPSILDHEVLMVEMTEEDENQKNGRYCITQFIKI